MSNEEQLVAEIISTLGAIASTMESAVFSQSYTGQDVRIEKLASRIDELTPATFLKSVPGCDPPHLRIQLREIAMMARKIVLDAIAGLVDSEKANPRATLERREDDLRESIIKTVAHLLSIASTLPVASLDLDQGQ